MVFDPLNLLLLNKECQDLGLFRFQFHVQVNQGPLLGERPNNYRRKNDTGVYHLFLPLETRQGEEYTSD